MNNQQKMATSRFYFCLLILHIFIPINCFAKTCISTQKTSLFVLGDSLFDFGNNNYINTTSDVQANRYPYGQTFFKYPTGRLSDGRTLPDFIGEYAKLSLVLPYGYPGYQSYIDGANFASAGAGALVQTRKGQVIDLRTQLSNFRNVRKILKQRVGKAEATKLLNKAVYFISIGSNDYLVRVTDNSTLFSSYSQHQYVDLVIGNLTYVIKEIHKTGGRKFGFVGLGPLGCFPLGKMLANGTGACLQQISPFIELHNKALSLLLQKLQKELKGFKYSLANFHDLVSQLMDHPTRYGLKEGNVACCGSGAYRGFYSCGGRLGVEDYELCEDPSEYVFFDSAHFTDKANHYLSQQMWSGNSNVVGPYNLKSLFEQ